MVTPGDRNTEQPARVAPARTPAKSGGALRSAGYALALVAGIFAAWQAHQALFRGGHTGPTRSSAGRMRLPASVPAPASLPPMPGTGAAYDPLAAAGVQLLDSDPTGIAPPDGARLTLAFTVLGGATLVCQAEYAWEGTIQAAADYYNRRLSADGWNVPARRGDEGRRRLTASDGDVRAIVNLREDADDARIVDIQVVLITPSDEEEQ